MFSEMWVRRCFPEVVQLQFQLVQGNERIGGNKVESVPKDNSNEEFLREKAKKQSGRWKMIRPSMEASPVFFTGLVFRYVYMQVGMVEEGQGIISQQGPRGATSHREDKDSPSLSEQRTWSPWDKVTSFSGSQLLWNRRLLKNVFYGLTSSLLKFSQAHLQF